MSALGTSTESKPRGARLERQAAVKRMRQSSSRAQFASPNSRTEPTPSSALSVDDKVDGDVHAGDIAGHFFAIETRLELKERLVVIQRQLADLLVSTKLAWMKCFADTSSYDEDEDDDYHVGSASGTATPSNEALLAANELVVKGEHVMVELQTAFAKATSTSNCPIKEYQVLVESVERDFADFQRLVARIAHSSFPAAVVAHSPVAHTMQTLSSTTLQASASEPTVRCTLPFPVSYDLPSMKSYCAKVAPPYSSYLAKKN